MPSVWERLFGVEADDIVLKGQLARTGQQYVQAAAGSCKVGATAGWTVAAAANTALVTLAASQTASTLVIPIRVPLKVG